MTNNHGGGKYRRGQKTVGTLSISDTLCGGPEGQMSQSPQFLTIRANPTEYRISNPTAVVPPISL
jgi:hypothetical protein